jgi:hypothetical protein
MLFPTPSVEMKDGCMNVLIFWGAVALVFGGLGWLLFGNSRLEWMATGGRLTLKWRLFFGLPVGWLSVPLNEIEEATLTNVGNELIKGWFGPIRWGPDRAVRVVYKAGIWSNKIVVVCPDDPNDFMKATEQRGPLGLSSR